MAEAGLAEEEFVEVVLGGLGVDPLVCRSGRYFRIISFFHTVAFWCYDLRPQPHLHRKIKLRPIIFLTPNQIKIAIKHLTYQVGRRQTKAHAALIYILPKPQIAKKRKQIFLLIFAHADARVSY